MQPTSVASNAALILEDGTILRGRGVGATGAALGEVCFNTAMTGHQEILTDPSYADQIVAFTFPHVGITGANDDDDETGAPHKPQAAKGAVIGADLHAASNWRSERSFDGWMASKNIVGVAGIDVRALVRRLRETGAMKAVLAHEPEGRVDEDALLREVRAWAGVVGRDLAKSVTARAAYHPIEPAWVWGSGRSQITEKRAKVAAIDFGVKRALWNRLEAAGLEVTAAPADATVEDLLTFDVDGYFLSNGPGDPAATSVYAATTVRALIESGKPVFGVCLGHQLIALALGAKTAKMAQGHHGANHPVKELATGKVDIVSMNHEYAVDAASLPSGVEETHVSLFDRSNCGLRVKDRPVFAVQFHPEASPGPQDSFALFDRFAAMCAEGG